MTPGRLSSWLRQEVSRHVILFLRPVLLALAFVWRRMLLRTTFIAVTGTSGKTTTKECLAAVLARQGWTFRSFRSQNNTLMVALNILRVRPWHRYAVIEAAGAQPGMMQASARLLRPDVAIVLNVMRAHTLAFTDLDAYAAEKAALVAATAPGGLAVLNADDDRVARMRVPHRAVATRFGSGESAEFRVGEARSRWPERLTFTLHYQGRRWPIETQLLGTQWLNSAGAVMATAISLGMDAPVAAAALKEVPPFAGRLNPAELPGGAIMLRDDLGATADTIEASLQVLRDATASRKLLVVTDLSDYPGHRDHRLRYLGRRAGEVADGVVFIGEHARYGARRAVDAGIAVENAYGFGSLKEAAEFLRTDLRSGDLVLLSGRHSDHVTRVFFAQLGSVGCWKGNCRKRILCDICWELDFRPADTAARQRADRL